MYMYTRSSINIYIYTHVYIYICMYVCMYACMYVCIYVTTVSTPKMVCHEPLPGCRKYLRSPFFVKNHHSSFPSEPPPLEIDLSHPDAGCNPAPVDRWFIPVYPIYWYDFNHLFLVQDFATIHSILNNHLKDLVDLVGSWLVDHLANIAHAMLYW